MGSGNAGATNAARVYGMGMGLGTLACDALKTTAAMYLGLWLGGETGFALAGAACLIGHCWPVFFRFRGGKGVSVGAIMSLLIDWRVFIGLLVVFFAVFALKRTVSLCSVTVAVLMPVLAVGFQLLTHDVGLPRCILAAFTGILVVWQHRSNLQRLARGEEAPFTPGKRPAR
jgi:glycerol-3-phosphate acyltransferase PlsY